jgi:hypothetical protein
VVATTSGVPAEVVADPAVSPRLRIVDTYVAVQGIRQPPTGQLVVTKVFLGDHALRGDVAIRVQCGQTPNFPNGTFDQTQTIPAPADCTSL